jgi:hypothetical protein
MSRSNEEAKSQKRAKRNGIDGRSVDNKTCMHPREKEADVDVALLLL